MRLKVIVAWLAIVLVSLVVAFMVTTGFNRIQTIEKSKSSNQSLSFLLHQISSNSSHNRINKSTVVIYFNSECEHCRWEIEQIDKNYKAFIESQLLFISYEDPCDAMNFLDAHSNLKLLRYSFLHISAEKVFETFGAEIVPQILIYKDDRLQKKFKGETKIAALIEFI